MRQDVILTSVARAKYNILIVDDNEDMVQLLEMLFRSKGYRTEVAMDGVQALQQIKDCPPDLVILDVMMPAMDGWETFHRLRDYSEVPVLILTALTSGEDAVRALELGAVDYMRKPFSTAELAMRVDNLLLRRFNSLARLEKARNGLQKQNRPSIATVIPAYNEERFIGSVVLKTRKYSSAVIVIDDGSKDATAAVATDAGALVISHDGNQGKGAALSTAFRILQEYQPDVVVMLDGDGQHLPEELSKVIQPVLNDEADIVIGSRYIKMKSDVPRHRILGHKVFNWITRVASGVPVSDSQSGFRAFSSRAMEAISFHSNGFSSNGFSVESEMQFIARENHLRLVEVPITIRYDDPPKRSVISQGLVVLNGILNLVGQYRPLLFFGVPGMFLIGVGIWWGLWVVDIYFRARQLATGYALLSVFLSLIGLLMVHTGFILHSIRGLLIHRIPGAKNH